MGGVEIHVFFCECFMFWKRDCSHSRLISPATRQNTVRVAKKNENFRMPGAISIFLFDLATPTVFWRGASGHENSLFECLDDYNSRFWSSNDDSCTLLQGRFATPFFSWCSFVKTLGFDAERANSRVDLQPLRCFGGVRQEVVAHFAQN